MLNVKDCLNVSAAVGQELTGEFRGNRVGASGVNDRFINFSRAGEMDPNPLR
jgi:hypothetical protein